MSVYHCPLCPLVFQYRTEVEWHLREEHRSRVDEDAALRAELAAATAPIDWQRLSGLRSSKGRPSVTLLLATTPAVTMTPLDIARLRQLAECARRRLSGEPDRDTPVPLVEHRLAMAVSTAETLATGRGMAVLVNRHDLAIFTLPFAPRDRQVVDDRFATRDLEYALRRHPLYRVLVLGRHPRILEGRGRELSEAAAQTGSSTPRNLPGQLSIANDDPEALLLERVRVVGHLPLIVIGDHRHLQDFRRHTSLWGDVIAEVTRPRLQRVAVADLATPALERWLSQQQQQAKAELLDAQGHDQVVWGVEAAWDALEARAADRLWVEHDYQVPGRIAPGVHGVQATSDPAEPGVLDDLVDALITKANLLGVTIDLFDAGALERVEPVAARIVLAAPEARSVSYALSLAAS